MIFYFVQRGETLYAIAKRYQTTVHAIVAANRLEDPNAICPGQALIIPRPGEVPAPPPGGIVHLVRPGETVFGLAEKFGSSAPEILRVNQVAHPEFVLPGQQLVIPEPVEVGDDWPMFGRMPGRTGASPVRLPGPPLAAWTHTPRRSVGVRSSAPVIRYDRIYVGLGDGWFYSLDRHTGRVKWRIPATGADVQGACGAHALAAPAVFDGLAYLCSPDGTIAAVDAYTGRMIWKVALDGPITSSPAVTDGVLYVGSWDEHVYALEAKTGAIVWKRQVGAVTAPTAVGDNQLFAVTTDGALWAVDAETGCVDWHSPAPASGRPVFAEVVVLVGGKAYDTCNGEVQWEVEAGNAAPIPRLDHVLYPDGVVDLFTGTVRRGCTADVPIVGPALQQSEPLQRSRVAAGGLLIEVDSDGRLHAWNAEDGTVMWSTPLKAGSHQPPAVAHGQLAISLEDGSLQTYRFIAGRTVT